VVGAVTGGGLATLARKQRQEEAGARQPVTVDELEQKL
jgi:hydrogenase small subunit